MDEGWIFVRPDVAPGELVLVVGKLADSSMVLANVAGIKEDNSILLSLPYYRLDSVKVGSQRFPSFTRCDDPFYARRNMKSVGNLLRGADKIADFLAEKEEFRVYADKIRNSGTIY